MTTLPSKLLADAVEALSSLPSIGRKTALRLALHLLQEDRERTTNITSSLNRMIDGIRRCNTCNNLSDHPTCAICQDPRRKKGMICVVETFRDVIAIEDTGHYRGLYHVLGGVISPMEGIGPSDLNLDALIDRVSNDGVDEVILAINPTIEGETTNFFLYKKLKDISVRVSTIARGVALGGELEYADEITLGHSISARRPYQFQE